MQEVVRLTNEMYEPSLVMDVELVLMTNEWMALKGMMKLPVRGPQMLSMGDPSLCALSRETDAGRCCQMFRLVAPSSPHPQDGQMV